MGVVLQGRIGQGFTLQPVMVWNTHALLLFVLILWERSHRVLKRRHLTSAESRFILLFIKPMSAPHAAVGIFECAHAYTPNVYELAREWAWFGWR